MKVYYLYDGKQRHGPYSIEELKEKSLSGSTLVWTDELSDWTKAADVEALKPLISPAGQGNKLPPPPPISHSPKTNNSNTRRYAIACILIAFIAVAGYFMLKPKDSSATVQKQPSSLVVKTESIPTVLEDTLAEAPSTATLIKEQPVKKEKFNPGQHLQKSIKVRKNFLGQTVIEGSIKNVSTKNVYKDIVLNVEYLSKTGSTISTQKLTVYEIARPNKRIPFKFKLRSPIGTANFSTEIIDAIVVN